MDARKTTPGDGDEGAAGNVVRLPRDWLGPREELVPIGSRARTAEQPDDDPTESLPPTAASFWDEDSGSIQAPMQAPAETWRGQWEATPAGTPSGRESTRRRRGIPRPRRPRSLSGRYAPSRRAGWAGLAGLVAASAVVVLAVIGQTEGARHGASDTTSSPSKSAAIVTATGANRARLRAHTPVVAEIKPEPRTHHAGRLRAGHGSHATTIRRRHARRSTPRPAESTSEPVRTTTPAYIPTPTTPTTNSPSGGSTAGSASATTDRSTSSSSQHQPAFGLGGSLGPGSSPDG